MRRLFRIRFGLFSLDKRMRGAGIPFPRQRPTYTSTFGEERVSSLVLSA